MATDGMYHQERGQQVALMGEIYSCASPVYIWAGQPTRAELTVMVYLLSTHSQGNRRCTE